MLSEDLPGLLLARYDLVRRPFPWRGEQDPYRVWVSEIMLQQTGTATVIPYYQSFLARFPTVFHLAAAEEEEVLAQWQGLGYYRRAIHLQRAARVMVAAGGMPEDLAGWMALPGVGRSTAGAILAICRDQPHPILDGNVRRVLARLIALAQPVGGGAGLARLWEVAACLTPRARPGDYAQAIMDLGAVVCTPRAPACGQCPWRGACRALAQGNPEAYPVAGSRVERPRREARAAVIFSDAGRVLLFRRPVGGLLGGLWEVAAVALAGELAAALRREFGVVVAVGESHAPVRHAFTHFHLTVHPFSCRHVSGSPVSARHEEWRWVDPETLPPLSTLQRKVLARVLSGGERH